MSALNLKKYKFYLPVILVFSFLVLIGWILFFKCGYISDPEKRLLALISYSALSLAILQLLVNQTNIQSRKTFELRYSEFKRQYDVINEISVYLNENTNQESPIDVHSVLSKLRNLSNEFIQFNVLHSEEFFPGIKNQPESVVLKDLMTKLIAITSKFQKKIDDATSKSEEGKSVVLIIEEMNWHNAILDTLNKIHDAKYDYFRKLIEYL